MELGQVRVYWRAFVLAVVPPES